MIPSTAIPGQVRAALAVALLVPALVAAAPPPSPAVAHGPANIAPDRRIEFGLALRFRSGALAADARRAATPLSAATIGERYGVGRAALRQVRRWLGRHGVTVTHQYRQRTRLDVAATARTVGRVFGAPLVRAGRGGYAPQRAPAVPRALSDVVTGVVGLDTRPRYHPSTTGRPMDSEPDALSPSRLQRAYGFDALLNAGTDGSGETVGILSLARMRGGEMKRFARLHDLPTPRVRTIRVGRARPALKGAGEVALDLEMVDALAPGAALVNYETANRGDSIGRVVNRVVDDADRPGVAHPRVLSISWGTCEEFMSRREHAADEAALGAAEAAGITVFVASGDEGPWDCLAQSDEPEHHLRPAVDYPSASGHVLAVGGTTLSVTAEGDYRGETAWWSALDGKGAGGGGSRGPRGRPWVHRPDWQAGPGVPDLFDDRLIPDVAGPSDWATNLEIVWWNRKRGYLRGSAGGTSAAAPFWAAATALLRQDLEQFNGRAFTALEYPWLLYDVLGAPDYTSAFHDVTTGGNPLFDAHPGWDFVTGIGTPDLPGLRDALRSRMATLP